MAELSTMTKQELKDLAINFYHKHGQETGLIKGLLEIRLTQICMAYCNSHNLPDEAVTVKTRIKTLDSFLNKLEKKGWPQFEHPAAVINDFIGSRITCWFLDDCAGILKIITQRNDIEIITGSVENYIANPKPSGYRALHALAYIAYDGLGSNEPAAKKMICEIQVRTRLQDAWGDITHDIYYRAKHSNQPDKMYYSFLNDISKRLLQEDDSLLQLKEAYIQLAKNH